MLEDEVDFSFFFEGLADADDVVAFEHFEHFDLTLDGAFIVFVFVGFLELFDGNFVFIEVEVPSYWVSLLMAFHTIP